MTKASTEQSEKSDRLQRILAMMVVSMIGLALAAFVSVIIATAAGVQNNDGFSQGIWPVVIILPLVALPLGFLLLIFLFVLNAFRRRRGNQLVVDNPKKRG